MAWGKQEYDRTYESRQGIIQERRGNGRDDNAGDLPAPSQRASHLDACLALNAAIDEDHIRSEPGPARGRPEPMSGHGQALTPEATLVLPRNLFIGRNDQNAPPIHGKS